jgi:hypothetical protein
MGGALGEAADMKTVGTLWIALGSIASIGIVAWVVRHWAF